MINPLRSEQEAFRFLLYVAAVVGAIVAVGVGDEVRARRLARQPSHGAAEAPHQQIAGGPSRALGEVEVVGEGVQSARTISTTATMAPTTAAT